MGSKERNRFTDRQACSEILPQVQNLYAQLSASFLFPSHMRINSVNSTFLARVVDGSVAPCHSTRQQLLITVVNRQDAQGIELLE